MLEVSESLKEYLNKKGRSFKGKIECSSDTVYEGIMSISVTRPFCPDTLTFGNVNIAYCNIAIYDTSVAFAGKEITVYIKALNGSEEWIKLGVFTAEKPTTSGKVTTFTAYDCIKHKTDITYFPSFSDTYVSISAVFEDVCTQCQVSFVPVNSQTLVNPSLISGYKCKDALGQIAGFLGGNIVTDNEGRVTVRTFKSCNYNADENMIDVPEISEETTDFKGISCITSQGTLVSGEEYGNHISFSNVLMTQEQLNSIWSEVKNMHYNALSVNILVGTPLLEVGDVFTVAVFDKTYTVPLMHYEIDFDGGIMNTCKSFYKAPEERKDRLSATEKLEEVSKEMEDVKNSVNYVKNDSSINSDFIKLLNSALGLYFSKETLSDGSVKIYGHNNPILAQSTYIFTTNSGGFAFTTGENCWNNGNPIWRNGITKEGNAIFNYLFAEKISANLIEAGVLKSIIGNTEFNLNSGIIRQTEETDEYTKNIFIMNGRTSIKKIYKNQDLTEISEFDYDRIMFIKEVTSTGDRLGYRQFTYNSTNLTRLALIEPLEIASGGTGADNYIDAQKNLGLEDGATRKVWWYSNTTDNSLGTEDFGKADLYVPSLGLIMNWNGAYLGSKSNLRYCYKGLFGDLAVKNWADTDNRYLRKYSLNEINIDNTNGCWTVDISEHGHGTYPEIVAGTAETWINVTQTTSGHFYIQTAIKCDKDDNAERKTRAMWIRNKYISGAWSKWTKVMLE